MGIDKPPGGFDGRLVVDAIHLNHADGSVVQSNDKCAIDWHVKPPGITNGSPAILWAPGGGECLAGRWTGEHMNSMGTVLSLSKDGIMPSAGALHCGNTSLKSGMATRLGHCASTLSSEKINCVACLARSGEALELFRL
jgi:hypothetical protein